jgi:hypothetical protein
MSAEPRDTVSVPLEALSTMSLDVARRELVVRVAETIVAQSFTGIVGEAEIGKTGILKAAVRYLRNRGRTVVEIDLDGAWSPNRLAWRWAIELARAAIGTIAVSHLHALDRSMWPASTRSAVLALPAALGEATAALAQSPHPPDGVGRDEVLRAPIEATLALARARPELVVLSLDHLEAPSASGLRSPDIARLLWSLRAPGQHLENLRVTVATRTAAQELASGPQAAYHQLGRWLTIQAPTAEEFEQASGIPTIWCARVLAYTGGHPSSTLEVLDELRVLTTSGRGHAVADLSDGYSERRAGSLVEHAILNVSQRHGDLARRATEHARTVHRLGGHLLTAVAMGQGPYQATPEIAGSEVAKAMVRLHLNGLVRRTGAQRGWETVDPRVRWALAGPASYQ